MKNMFNEFFDNRDPDHPDIQKALDNQHYAMLPITPSGNFLFFHGLHSFEPKDYDFDSSVKTFLMMGGK